MTRTELEFDLTEAMNETYSRDRRNVASLRILTHDATQRAEIVRLREAMERIVESEGLWTKNDMAYEAQQALRESTK